MSNQKKGFGMSHAPKKWGVLMKWKNTADFAGDRKSIRKMSLGGLGNGTHSSGHFNGKHDKHLKKAKGFVAPVYSPKVRQHPGSPTSRFIHQPWPFKRKSA